MDPLFFFFFKEKESPIAPVIPRWSPLAYLPKSDLIGHVQGGMAKDGSSF